LAKQSPVTNKIASLGRALLAMTYCKMGTEGIEPSRLAAHDPKSCSSASSDTSPSRLFGGRNYTAWYVKFRFSIADVSTCSTQVCEYNPALEPYIWSNDLSRVINPESAGKDRTRLTKAIVLAVRELAKQKDVTDEAKDLAAFIALALKTISEGIDVSVAAWEKRDYWVKADKFRMEWMWSGQYADKMKVAIFTDDWGTIAMLMPQIAQKFSKIVVSDNHRLGKPWVGAYKQLTTHQ
jgi:hypothetical protein